MDSTNTAHLGHNSADAALKAIAVKHSGGGGGGGQRGSSYFSAYGVSDLPSL